VRTYQAYYTLDMFGRELREALTTLGELLEERSLSYEIVVIGGASLLLLGLIARPTADVDVLAWWNSGKHEKADGLPPELQAAVAEVGDALQLGPRWLNTGPADLIDFGLPDGFEARTSVERFAALAVHLPARVDLISFKLYAVVDHGSSGKHMDDLRDLEPTSDELLDAARWIRTHDPSDGLAVELLGALQFFGVEVPDGGI
jgi:hypothetical protein